METIPCDKENLPVLNGVSGKADKFRLSNSPVKTPLCDVSSKSCKKPLSARRVLSDVNTSLQDGKSGFGRVKKSDRLSTPIRLSTPKSLVSSGVKKPLSRRSDVTPRKFPFSIRTDSPEEKPEQKEGESHEASNGNKECPDLETLEKTVESNEKAITNESKLGMPVQQIKASVPVPMAESESENRTSDKLYLEDQIRESTIPEANAIFRIKIFEDLQFENEPHIDRCEEFLQTPRAKPTIKRSKVDTVQPIIKRSMVQEVGDSEISEFIELDLDRSPVEVVENKIPLEDDIPSFQLIPPTPMDDTDKPPEAIKSVTSSPAFNLTESHVAHSDPDVSAVETVPNQYFQTDPQFDLNKDCYEIFCDTCLMSDSHLQEIGEQLSDTSVCDIAMLNNDSLERDDFDKENISPDKLNSFSSLHVECNTPPSPIDSVNDSNFKEISKEFSPSSVCSPMCFKNFQSKPNRQVLAPLPLPFADENDLGNFSGLSFAEDFEFSSVFIDKAMTTVFDLENSEGVSTETITAYTDNKSSGESVGFQVFSTETPIKCVTQNTGCSPMRLIQTSTETNTEQPTYANVSLNTECVNTNSIGLSPFKPITKDSDMMTETSETLDRSMATEAVDVLDHSMMTTISESVDNSMMTDTTGTSNVHTDMTPLKLLNKRGKRFTAEEVRKQHPRTVANYIDTTLVSNEKLQLENKTINKEKTKLQTTIKGLKTSLSSANKHLQEYDQVQNTKNQEIKSEYKGEIKKLKSEIEDKDNTLQQKRKDYEELQLKFDKIEKESQVNSDILENRLQQQSLQYEKQIEDLKKTISLSESKHQQSELLLKDQEEQIQLLSHVVEEGEMLATKQSQLISTLNYLLNKVQIIVKDNYSAKKQIQLQWDYLQDKRCRIDVEIEAYKMNNKLLLEECEDLKESLQLSETTIQELEIKYLDAEKDLLSASSKLDLAKRELDFSRTTIQELGSLEDDLSTAYTEIQMLQSTLKQTEDTVQHEQYRFTSLQEEYTDVKTDLENELKQSESLVLNLQRTVDFREADIEKLEQKLLANYNYIEQQKETLDNLEEQLFNCQEQMEQNDVEMTTIKENGDLLLGERNICLQSALELEEKVKTLESTVETLNIIKSDQEEKYSKLQTSFTQLEQDYLASRQSLKDRTEEYQTMIQGKTEEIQNTQETLQQFDQKLASYIHKLHQQISHKEFNRRQHVLNGLSSSLEHLDNISDLTDRNSSILGPNSRPNRTVSNTTTMKSAFQPIKSCHLTSSAVDVRSQTSTPAKSSSPSTEMYLQSCKKLKALVNGESADNSPAGKQGRRLNFNQSYIGGNMSLDHVKDCAALDLSINQSINMSLSNSIPSRDSSPRLDSLAGLLLNIEKNFEELMKLVLIFEKSSLKTTEELITDKEELAAIRYKLENHIQYLKSELTVKAEAIRQANEDVCKLEKKLQELNNCMVKYSDQQEQIKKYVRENKKLSTSIENQQDDIKLLTEELELLFNRTSKLNNTGIGDRQEVLELKRKNQHLRMKIIEDYNSYSESENKSKSKLKTVEENLLQSKAEVCRYTELVDSIKETLVKNKSKLEEMPSLNKLLNVINGSDVYSTTPAKNSFQSFYDSFLF